MSTAGPVATIGPDATVAEAAAEMHLEAFLAVRRAQMKREAKHADTSRIDDEQLLRLGGDDARGFEPRSHLPPQPGQHVGRRGQLPMQSRR